MRQSESSPRLEFWIPADPKAVPQARHKAMQVCLSAGLSDDGCFTLDLALGEALANAVLYGAPSDATAIEFESHVHLSLWDYQDRLIIQIRDHGPGFDPPRPPYLMPLAAHEETHGRGLPLMETLTDAMIVCQGEVGEGGSSVFLIKKLSR